MPVTPPAKRVEPVTESQASMTDLMTDLRAQLSDLVSAATGGSVTAAQALAGDVPLYDLGVDSLGFLSVDGLYWAMGEKKRNAENPQFTDHAFTGEYPTPLSDYNSDRASKDFQLSLLAEQAAE